MPKPKQKPDPVKKTISIPKNQAEWLKENHISLSSLVQACINEEMKKWKNVH